MLTTRKAKSSLRKKAHSLAPERFVVSDVVGSVHHVKSGMTTATIAKWERFSADAGNLVRGHMHWIVDNTINA
jgi:hypothetical protein